MMQNTIKVISNVRHFGAYQEFVWEKETDKAVDVKTGKAARGGVALWINPGTVAHFRDVRVVTMR